MKTTIFIRILLATLLPLIFVFTLVITTISNLIYDNEASSAQEITIREARQIARQVSMKMETVSGFLEVVSGSMAKLDHDSSEAESRAQGLIRRLLRAEPSFYSTWFAFEPGVFPGRGHVYQTLIRKDGGIAVAHDMTPEILADPERSPWYNVPVSRGRIYINMTEKYDYGMGAGEQMNAGMAAPIIVDGAPVGAVGIDIDYDDMFETDGLRYKARWEIMVVSRKGEILWANREMPEKRNLLDYPYGDRETLKTTLEGGAAFMEEAFNPLVGAKSLICLYPISLMGGTQSVFLYLSIPAEDIYSSARSSMELIISTSLLGLLLLGFSVFVATRNIVRPIRQLTKRSNMIANDDLAMQKEGIDETVKSNVVELDILQDALSKMLTQINQTHELRLRATEEKLEKDKALAESQAKSQFFANMSHEIRTPMNAILGITEILLHSDRLTEQERKYINDIKLSSDTLLTIINDILDISKLESGKLTLAEQDYNFLQLIDNIRSMAEYLAVPNKLTFNLETRGELPECLRGDDIRLRQVLINLISNACKFTRQGAVTFRVEAADDTLIFAIADTGSGISPEDMANLFQPFKRLDTTQNRKVQGTGLGLSICKNLVEMMGGKITVESELGKGSVFTVVIPKVVGQADAVREKSETGRVSYLPGVKLLVVDDNEINLSVAEGLLQDLFGITCDLALSGAEAIEKVQEKDYVLVFMDHMMPEMDGLEATKRIRALGGKYAELPIIAFTANAIKGAREIMMEAGINDYLTKPIDVDEMDRMLAKWIPDTWKAEEGKPT